MPQSISRKTSGRNLTQLVSMRRTLARQVALPEVQRAFKRLKARQPALTRISAVTELLAVMGDQSLIGRDGQEGVLRILVAQVQAVGGDREIWQKVLFYAFLPALIRVRSRTRTTEVTIEDMDSIMWTSFFEVLQSYPLRRPGSVAAGILRDTRKRYFRSIDREREAITQCDELQHDRHATNCWPSAVAVDPPSPAQDPAQLLTKVKEQNADLIRATVLEGMTVRAYMQARCLDTGDAEAVEQTFQRLKRQRHRLLQRLRREFVEAVKVAS